MKKTVWLALSLFSGLILVASSLWAVQPYQASIKDITDIKDVIDDPAPFYTDSNYYKKFIPDEVWEQLVHDPEESRAAWEKAIGFRARDLVGKIAPEIKPGKYTLADKEKYPFKELMTEYHYKRFNAPGTEGLPNHIGMYTEIEVIETQQLWYAKPLAEATLENMGKTQLDEEGYIKPETYVSGFPFPRPAGEHVPMQLLYNWQKRFKDHENTANYDLTIGVNSRGNIDHRGTAHYMVLRTRGTRPCPTVRLVRRACQEERGGADPDVHDLLAPRSVWERLPHYRLHRPEEGSEFPGLRELLEADSEAVEHGLAGPGRWTGHILRRRRGILSGLAAGPISVRDESDR